MHALVSLFRLVLNKSQCPFGKKLSMHADTILLLWQ